MREFLKGLDLDKETIDTIMAEHGKIMTGLREQVDNYKDEVATYKSTIEENQKSLSELESIRNERNDLKAEAQMSGSNVRKEFQKFVRSEVMANVNDETDFATALETYKKDNPQYFGSSTVKVVQSSPNLNTGGNPSQSSSDIMNDIIRGALNNE